MNKPDKPRLVTDDEEGRARALEALNILDTAAEAGFETIVEMVREKLNVPMCAVSLVDRERQWFKARRGLDVCETARDVSFCTHTIATPAPLVVPDTLADAVFQDNPLVTGAPHIRAYAGVPLILPNGYAVGTLCAIDDRPRDWSKLEIEMLKGLAKLALKEITIRS